MIEINDKVLADVKQGFNLPPKPELLTKLQEKLMQSEPDLNEVAALISTDIATSASVLKVMNSPCYGLARSITDIRQAVMFLGLESITRLVTGFLIKQAFEQRKCCIKLDAFWDTAAEVADVASMIGQKLKSKIPAENLHMLGLFHDAGIPAMASKYDNYGDVMALANSDTSKNLVAHEDSMYACNHAVVGYFLACSWHLPKSICDLILRHHDTDYFKYAQNSEQEMTLAALKLAENLVKYQKKFTNDVDWLMLQDDIKQVLMLDDDYYLDIKEDVSEYYLSKFG